MAERPDGISRRQLSMLLFVSALSPLIRQTPGMAVLDAGRAVWLSALLALLPLPLGGWMLGRLLRRRRPGEGLGGVILTVFGNGIGTAAVLLFTVWTVFYAGFVLRAGADRFVTAVYTGSPPWLFMAVMAALCVPACLGRLRTLARCAEIALGALLAVFALVFAFCVPGIDAANLVPLGENAFSDALRGVPRLLSTLTVPLLLAFLSDRTEPGALTGSFDRVFLALGLLSAALCVTVVGTFGAELTGEMHYPFFVMIRCIRIFRLLERIEALVVAQWVVTDFLLLGALLQAAAGNLTLCFPKLSRRRGAVGLGALALCILSGALCAPTAFSLRTLQAVLVPIASAAAAGLLVLTFLVGLARKKL